MSRFEIVVEKYDIDPDYIAHDCDICGNELIQDEIYTYVCSYDGLSNDFSICHKCFGKFVTEVRLKMDPKIKAFT